MAFWFIGLRLVLNTWKNRPNIYYTRNTCKFQPVLLFSIVLKYGDEGGNDDESQTVQFLVLPARTNQLIEFFLGLNAPADLARIFVGIKINQIWHINFVAKEDVGCLRSFVAKCSYKHFNTVDLG